MDGGSVASFFPILLMAGGCLACKGRSEWGNLGVWGWERAGLGVRLFVWWNFVK